jgi:hypothetical protein
MKKLFLASGLAVVSLATATHAEAACRQVYGGTSCNWMGQCWHNPPKTVCDAPPPRIAPQPTVRVQPGAGLISNNRGGIINQDNAGLISNRAGGILSQNGVNQGGRGGGLISDNGLGARGR